MKQPKQIEPNTAQRCWVQIDLAAIEHNYRAIREKLQAHVRLLAVVKAEAYGHGAVTVGRLLEKLGVDMLGVTTVAEGLALRQGGITLPILVFGPFLPQEAEKIVAHDLIATIADTEAIAWLGQTTERLGKKVEFHLKVETGMGRTGLWPRELKGAAEAIAGYAGLELTGVYSHLASASSPKSAYSKKQFAIFQGVCRQLEEAGYTGLVRHIANSGALLNYPEMHLDMVRTGTLLFGQYPSSRLAHQIKLKDPWSFWARVSYVRDLPAGHSVGYGQTYTSKRATRVAVLPVGYCDGLQMEPVFRPINLLELLKGMVKLLLQYLNHPRMAVTVRFPQGSGRIIGKVGMQLTMVDITDIPEVQVGSPARIPVRRTAVNPQIARVYVNCPETACDH
ncbi:MAG: alanine racemase [Peptococcia bacterium]